MDHGGRGLVSLAHRHREGGTLAPELWRQTLPLTQQEDPQRRLLPGFSSAGSARLFEHIWSSLGESFAMLDEQGADVIVDAGRISVTGLPLGMLAAADVVLVCVRSTLRSLAAARIHLLTLEDQLRGLTTQRPWGLVVIGPGRPYTTGEIAAQFGIPAWVEQAWDPRSAAVLSDGEPEPRRFRSGRFMGGFRSEAHGLADRVQRMRDQIAAVAEPVR